MTAIDFVLPAELEAREPAELRGSGRDDVRLLVTRRSDDAVMHAHFRELPRFLNPGDLLVLNTTATLPAALSAVREDGAIIALHVSTSLPGGLALVEPRGESSSTLMLPGDGKATLLAPYRDSSRLWLARIDVPDLRAYLARYGRPIHYSYIERPYPIDAYQTVFAAEPGSAEMPSAGRAFTRSMLVCLRRSGVRLAKLVLHAGVASLERHERPHEEYFEVPLRTAEEVRRTKERGGRVIAVGTTVVRALESSLDDDRNVIASRGWTDLVITPERGVFAVDGLLTGLHEPRATHLAMLEAIAGREHVQRGYEAALAEKYLWHEFGDLHLIV
ncbi:MAG TPA: S-adenosylmethionine:tRNA ribosyltransferase-isomerase [Thermoanaerobaculia bacterium]|nr:S-adenosylmethionine:tRNA ribosyltransferase-isomerase [Thermoanaerobaculia bacterium]